MQNKSLHKFLVLAPLAFLLHNLEESLTMVSFVQQHMTSLPAPIRLLEERLQVTQASFMIPVILLTVLMAWVSFRLLLANPPRWMIFAWPVAMLALCANAFIHIVQGVWLGGYAPGLITAVLLQLPITLLSVRASVQAGWIGRRAVVFWFFAGFPLVGIISIAFLFLGKALASLL